MDPLEPGLKWTKRRRRRTSRARARSGLKVIDLFRSHPQCPQPQPVSEAFLSQEGRPRTGVVPQPGPRYHFLPDTSVTGQWGQSSAPPMKQPQRKAEQRALSCCFQSPNMLHGSVDFNPEPDEAPREKVFGRVECVSPVVLLSQLYPRLRFSCVCERPHGGAVRSFVMLLWLEGRVFEGCGRSKGVAKARAAACALYTLHRLHPEAELRGGGPMQQMHQLFAESICALVTEKSRELSLSSSSAPPPLHKGLAGIVLTTGLDLRSAQVVAMATGTKYFSSDSAVEDGLTVRDCHAEALCRRALLCFLYDQLELLLRGPSDAEVRSTFVPVPGEGAVFRLRDDLQLHMFLSCPPCGDARLHWPYTSSMAPKRDKRTQRWSCGVRVKVSGGEGTVPVSQPGTARLSMSCTDKMAKWCVAGVQGALLSHLVEPIYLHSVTIATQSHPGHMRRVLRRRLAPVKRLQFPYRRQMFLLGCVGCYHPLSHRQGAHMSLSWTQGQGSEVIRVSSGQAHGEEPSRLCPGAMFHRWTHIYRTITGEDAPYRTCSEAKMAAADYRRALRRFRAGLQEAGLQEAGLWDRTPRLYP